MYSRSTNCHPYQYGPIWTNWPIFELKLSMILSISYYPYHRRDMSNSLTNLKTLITASSPELTLTTASSSLLRKA